MEKELNGHCQHCGTPIHVEMCCSGYMCGCYGQPAEPPVCSEYCFYMAYPNNVQSDNITPEQMEKFKNEWEDSKK